MEVRMPNISTRREGRRTYIVGNTYAHKDALRGAGAKWDPDAKAWWIGNDEKATALAASLGGGTSDGTPAASEGLKDSDTVMGRGRYKGRSYLVLWVGDTQRGRACKLAFTDGSKTFWADAEEVSVEKRYEEREYRGRVERMTFGRLKRLREEFKASGGDPEAAAEARAERSDRCRGCGGPIRDAGHHQAAGGYCGSCAFDEYDG
jgi:hypothetical protein